MLIKSSIKKNLYYEIKDQVKEERYQGAKTIYKKQKVKSYGTDNTHETRTKLMELLHQRVAYHKDKFIAPILHDEMCSLEVKPNGKIEHASNAHDDQIFSYLMALYVWYYGENLMERFHIFKNELKTDQDMDETQFDEDERYGGLEEIEIQYDDPDIGVNRILQEQKAFFESSKTMTYEEFMKKEEERDRAAMEKILGRPDGRDAVAKAFNIDLDYLNQQHQGNVPQDISNQILSNFYGNNEQRQDQYEGNLSGYFRKLK